jgi:glutamate synthase domain-containing protein 1
MAIPLRNRSDLKAAGRAMAHEAVDAIAAHFATLTGEEMEDPARIDAVTERMIEAAVEVGRIYLKAGIPPAWVRCFISSFQRTASARLADHSLAARAPAGTA